MKKITKRELIEFVLILLLFEPTICIKYLQLNILYILGALASFYYIFYETYRRKISKLTISIILFRIYLIIMTLYNGGDVFKVGYISIVVIALFLYGEKYFSHNKGKEFIFILDDIALIYLSVNIILYSIFPNGIFSNVDVIHFLGYRTRFAEYAFLLLLTSILRYNLNSKKGKIRLAFSLYIVLLNIILPKISTAIVGLLVFTCTFIISKKIKLSNYRWIIYLSVLLAVCVIFFKIQNLLAFFIEGILKKSITLSYRTQIWDNARKYIFDDALLIGHGYPKNGNFIYWSNNIWQAHNQILQLLYEVGIIGVIWFYGIILEVVSKLNYKNSNIKNRKNIDIIVSVILAFGIMMITEIYSFYLPFYAVLIICIYNQRLYEGKNNIINIEEKI